MRLNNEKGIALVFTLLVITVLLILSSIFIYRAINEWNTAHRERRSAQAFYIAEGGSHASLDALDKLINTDMFNTVNAVNPSIVIADTQGYVSSGDGLGLLMAYVKDSGVPQLTLMGSEANYSVGSFALGGGAYQFDIVITEKSNPVAVGPDQWDFPYYYRIESSGFAGNVTRKVLLLGDFTVRVQRDNFAKYALFTNQQTMPSGTNVWFTDKTNFAGPIHTNARYNIALNPSGIFDGIVTQHETHARYYNTGAPLLLDDDHNGTRDVPTFNTGFVRGAAQIALSSPVQKQDIVDQALGGTTVAGSGIYIPNNGTDLTGGIYVEGDATLQLGVDINDYAVYTVNQGGVTKIITVDTGNNQTIVETLSVGTETFNGIPDGVNDVGTLVFINGNVNGLSGTIQSGTEITISSENNIKITNHLTYSNYTPAQGTPGQVGYVPPNATGTANLLGLVSWNGDIRVGTAAPDDVNIHGTLLARNGIFQVDNYNDYGIGPRGTATLLGGVITDYYGAFGLFSGATGQQLTGYGRNFVYDDRMSTGAAPPYFPSLNTFIAFTNDIMDKITLQEGGF